MRNQHLKWKKVFKVLSFLRKCKKICTAISTCHFWSAENSSKNDRLGILKLVKPDICLKTDNINYVPLNPFFMFCWIEFWDMFFGVYLVPPRRPCLAAIMSNHHQFPISPAPPPTPPNQPSAKTKKGWRKKNIKLFNVLNSLISSSDNHHEKKSVIRATKFFEIFFSHRFSPFSITVFSWNTLKIG